MRITSDVARIGFMTFGDHRPDMWKNVFSRLAIPLHQKAMAELKKLPVELVCAEEVARTRDQINDAVDYLKSQNVDVLVAHVPCWTSPNLVVHGVQRMGIFTVILGNRDPGSHGCVGLLGASGALSQIGFPHRCIRENYDGEIYQRKVLPLLNAAAVREKLKGSVFGLFGGRSIGIDTSTYDPMQWKTQFGVDSEHLDQVEIIRVAETIPQDRIDKHRDWLEAGVSEVVYNDAKLTKEKFDFQIACYLATKDLVKEYGMDFVALKCMHELSNSYVPQCITQALLANYDDAEGEKETTPIACEADADGALTQQILKLLSGGKPTFFADVSHIDNDRKKMYCVNCGALCVYYANRSNDTRENLKKIVIKQSVRPGGGGITYFNAAPGPMQLARLYRKNGKYKMAIIPCQAEDPTKEMLEEFIEARGPHQLPALFAKVDFDLDAFINEYGSNHISGVEGNYLNELLEVCSILDIEAEVFA
ncbi:L-fucose/L-arabinose isomerase family protein [Marispirochaeta aestuarii]|nr:L-fucose isomerase [Marispirochaeta aestuarii]